MLVVDPSRRRISWQAVLAALWFAWVSNFMVRSALAPALVRIRSEFQLDHAQAGLLATSFLAGYSLMLLPGGLLGDHVGRRGMVIVASFGWAAISLLIGLAPSFGVLLLLLLALGMVMGLFNANDRPIVSTVTPPGKMAVGQGLTYTGLGIGNGLGVMIGGAMAGAWGWRASYVTFAGLSLLAAAILWRCIPALPVGRAISLTQLARSVLHASDLWLLYLCGMPSVAVAWLLITWAPTILASRGLDLTDASLLASGVGFAAVPALALSGMLSDMCARAGLGRKIVIASGHIVLAATLLLFAIGLDHRWPAASLGGLMLLVSFAQWSPWGPSYALLAEISPPAAMGFTFGLGATVWALGAVLVPWLSGAVRDATGSFAAVFYVMAALALLGSTLAGAIGPAFSLGREKALQ